MTGAHTGSLAAGSGARHAYEVNRQRIASVWAQAQPVAPGDAADQFLRASGAAPLVPATAWPEALRTHAALPYWQVGADGQATCPQCFPALLVPFEIDTFPQGVRAAPVPQALALQRIYLAPAGTLAAVPAPIKLTGQAGPSRSALARLLPFDPAAGVLGIAVGAVAALRIARAARLPVWAVPDAPALAHARWPREAHSVHVFVDQRAPEQWQPAAELARKARACGLQVFPMAVQLAHAPGVQAAAQLNATRL